MSQPNQLIDTFGRRHTSLRVSVTDRCNVRCFYCMPHESIQFLPRPEILSFEEISRVTRVFAGLGINRIRITGGEPLVRKQLPELIRQLKQIESIAEIAMTTNGILLAGLATQLRQCGLDRLNVSLDSLDAEQFKQITRRDELEQVLSGIQAAQSAGFENIRINAVAVRGLIDSQVIPLVQFCLEQRLELRFIEFMPLNSTGQWASNDVLSGAEIRNIIESNFGKLKAVDRHNPSQPASDFEFANPSNRIRGRVGFINSVTEPFCEACDRLRLTADGKIRNCLFSHEEWDVRDLMRSGASDRDIELQIIECVKNKKAAHGIGTSEFQKPARAMYQIGG